MVKICPTIFDFDKCDNINDTSRKYCQEQFKKYPFELDHFQKYAAVGIETGKHVLVTAHTGSGKSNPAEYAISKFCNTGKKVIYTGPIKSLSNQKYYEFTQKYPEISFGIMTGDIKFNPEADCIIMTTEILRNALYNCNSSQQDNSETNISNIQKQSLEFNLNIEQDVACVIFDEVHYINDQDRGKVWEECIMNMPNQIQMVMLSATIDREYEFAKWIEECKKREVWISSTNKRVVPLNHYLYYTTNTRFDKHLSSASKSNTSTNLDIIKRIHKQNTDKFLLIKNSNDSVFNDPKNDYYGKINKIITYAEKNNLYVNKQDVINRVVTKLNKANMLPAICFVFSRKQVESYAKYIEHSLFTEDETKKQNTVETECKKILMKFPNYKEYIELPEYNQIITLLKKGIAIHHSGILPVLREMIELMFDKGYVKLLFATETFAVGINMPTKTVLFTSLSKYSSNGFRYVLPHEYTQMAGRAGRRGLDDVGHVIHLNNLFEYPNIHSYNHILSGIPQTLSSKFKIEPNTVLKLFNKQTLHYSDEVNGNNINKVENDTVKYLNTSMEHKQRTTQIKEIQKQYDLKCQEYTDIQSSFSRQKTNVEQIEKYVTLTENMKHMKHKKRKSVERELNQIEMNASRNFKNEIELYKNSQIIKHEMTELKSTIDNLEIYSSETFKQIYGILKSHEFIHDKRLTMKGIIASNLNEINSIVVSTIIHNKQFDYFDVIDLITYISLFIPMRVSEENQRYSFEREYITLQNNSMLPETIKSTKKEMEYYYDMLLKSNVEVLEQDFTLYFDIYDLVNAWCFAENEENAKQILQQCYMRGIFVGEFIKCLLKIVNITNELNSIAKKTSNIKLEFITSEVEEKILKFVATNQSLYV